MPTTLIDLASEPFVSLTTGAVDGEAKILADTSRVEALEAEKYGCLYRMIGAARGVARRLRREPPPESVTIEIVPGDRA